MNDSALSKRLITCISDTFNRTRRWKSMTLNLYLDQQEDLFMRVFKIYFDHRYNRGQSSVTRVSDFLRQIWYLVYDKIRSPKECAIVTEKLLHYLKLISAFPVNNIEESDTMAT
eukprot:UN23307